VSWSSPEVLDVMRECFLDNARRWSESRSLQAVVDVAAGY
jgi:hypothetical protein